MSVSRLIYNIASIRDIERYLIQLGISDIELMERAGKAAFIAMQQYWPNVRYLAVICGNGNNAGDGYILARLAQQQNYHVIVYQLDPQVTLQGPALLAQQACQKTGVCIKPFVAAELQHAELIIDAILGIGLKGSLRDPVKTIITAINQTNLPVLALDIPSGLLADTGAVLEVAVKATVTMTFLGIKPGMLTAEGPQYSGNILLDDLATPSNIYQRIKPIAHILPSSSAKTLLPPRIRNAHKGNFGHVLVIGGNYGMAGAVAMTAMAAARVGAGLISVVTRPEHVNSINILQPELLCYGLTKSADIKILLARATVVVIGPGLGKSKWSQACMSLILATNLPLLLDADALNLLAERPKQRANWILTPHPGEAARLLKTDNQTIQADRFAAAKQLQNKYSGVVVLKGAGTIIQTAQSTSICTAGNPGMASAGMGDVLSGVIAGLLAQGLTLVQAAELGVCLHAQAGDLAAVQDGERGLLATDLLPYLRHLVNQ